MSSQRRVARLCGLAHAPGQLEWIGLGCEQAAEAGEGNLLIMGSGTLIQSLIPQNLIDE